MKIAVNAADLDHQRIDGTRIYISNMLKNFGLLDKEDQFLIYHQNNFNPQLKFPEYENYEIKKLPFPFWWTQTRFAWEIMKEKPDVLWMPMHSLPYLRRPSLHTVVTIHDLAFKFFPQFFPKKDLRRLNYFTDYAVKNADRLIAVSNSTKEDILKVYPKVPSKKIKVIYHGVDHKLFHPERNAEMIQKTLEKYKISASKYLIYVGAIQPRKNIETLVDAFLEICGLPEFKNLSLVLAGEIAWFAETSIKKIRHEKNIILVEHFDTADLPHLLKGAGAFVMPSLYEGFGLPVLEAMACAVPVVAAENSSTKEILDGNGLLFKPKNSSELAESLRKILKDDKLKNALREKGLARVQDFSWEKCARETLGWLKS